MTASVPDSERAATPAARRITSADHSSRGLPSPTASTLATGSDGATTRVTCSVAALGAQRLQRHLDLADGLGVEERVGDHRRGVVVAGDHRDDQHRRRRRRAWAGWRTTVTAGDW